ncbi:MAG: eukaryotic-like serine/threonine-protein kinase [Myxococcales bacterium]|nr:eukaryotic-like serine/threonine-protein kinase [Myxococcales bacterium]
MERARPGVPIAPLVRVGVAGAQEAVKVGSVIGDKYRVEQELGRGGFGVVVRARHLAIDQLVAIKVLTVGEDSAWKEDAARFKREGQATAALRSEHVVRILDVDFLPGGSPYMVMEHLEGETLHVALHTRGPLSIGEAVDHMVQVLAALAEAHAAGIVHRDLKPANVFITRGAGGTMVAKVLDFGVSKVAAHSGIGAPAGMPASASQPITKTGAVIGTVAYMAPEQMLDAKRVDARADLWSVGVMLFELLTKKLPFGLPSDPGIVTTMLTQPPLSLGALRADVPPKLEKAIMRCLEKLPQKRYATASAVAAALEPFTTPRARAALDALRRAGRPSGAAAPIEKAAPALIAGGPRDPARARKVAFGIAVLGVALTVLFLGLTVGVVVGRRSQGETEPKPTPARADGGPDAAPGTSRKP